MFFNLYGLFTELLQLFSGEITSEIINKPKFRQLQVSLN